MPKESGLGWTTLSIDDGAGTDNVVAIKNDVTNFDFSTPRGVQDITGVDKSANERLLLLADFQITLNGVFNDTATDSWLEAFAAAGKGVSDSSAARTLTMVISSQTLANEVMLSDMSMSRSATGEFTWTVTGQLSDGTVPAWS